MREDILEFYKSKFVNHLNESKSKIVQDVLNTYLNKRNSSNTSSSYSMVPSNTSSAYLQTNTNPNTPKSDIPFKNLKKKPVPHVPDETNNDHGMKNPDPSARNSTQENEKYMIKNHANMKSKREI